MDSLQRKRIMMVMDAILVNLAILAAFSIRFDTGIPTAFWDSYLTSGLLITAIRLITFRYYKLYDRVWEYASIGELVSTMRAVSVGTVLVGFAVYAMTFSGVYFPRGVIALDWMLNILLIGGSRLVWRMMRDGYIRKEHSSTGRSTLIVGAGDAGALVAKDMRNHYNGEVNIVGFVDDNPGKQNLTVFGYPILGTRTDIPTIAQQYAVEDIVIAMPSINGNTIREIVALCHQTGAKVKLLPGVYDLIEGNVTVSKIREVELDDLLGRAPVKVDLSSVSTYIEDQVVLVTGAGGTIGSELCRQIVEFSPQKLLLLDVSENDMYDIEMELRARTQTSLVPLVKDVRDREAIDRIFATYRPSVVLHAAAHKHVPLMEANPEEAIKTNTMGTYFVARAADRYGAGRFVLVSTDKAVNPTSVMGASKRVAEMIVQYLDRKSETNYVAVRFGNVLGSRGSVVPLFKKQIAKGGPVTVTDPGMVRYFMTVPEAVQLIIQAGSLAQGGEIFLLDMGDPVRIVDLAETLVRLSGLRPHEDIEIQYSGIRPGEKLAEELLTSEEGVAATTHERIAVAKPCTLNEDLLAATLQGFVEGQRVYQQADTVEFIRAFLPDFRIVRYQAQESQTVDAKNGRATMEEVAVAAD